MIRAALLLACFASIAHAQENTPRQCQNDLDDDDDGALDCADPDCRQLIFCIGEPEPEASITVAEVEVRAPDPLPDVGYLEHDDPRRYPQAHVLQPLTYLTGMLVPELGISVRDDFAIDDPIAHLGVGLTYGILDLWQVSILPVPIRLSPSAAYEDPSIASTLRIVEHEVVEVGIYTNVVIPVTEVEGTPEPLPTEHLLARSRSGSSAELDLAIPLRFHLGEVVRVDLTPDVTLVFSENVRADVSIPLRIAVQVAPFAYVALFSGAVIPGPDYDAPKIPLGFSFGTTIPGTRRGPIADAAVRFGWPALYDPARTGEEVSASGWQITIDARIFSYLLP
jgi:hypothetical protein